MAPAWGALLSVVFAVHESSLSIGFGKSNGEVKTALLTGVLFVRWDAYLNVCVPPSCSSEEFTRGESKQHVEED